MAQATPGLAPAWKMECAPGDCHMWLEKRMSAPPSTEKKKKKLVETILELELEA